MSGEWRCEGCGKTGDREALAWHWQKCPANYASSLPVLDGERVLAPDGTPIGEVMPRRCPECGSREINATEAVCLACSNRAWGDR